MASAIDSPSYRRYVLFVLVLVYISNFADRQVLVILLEPIKAEMGLSDTQLGLLSGLAFALFYATLGIPLARFADKHNRISLITVCIGIWSAMTALCGTAASFAQLLLYRIGVGVGEAGCVPASQSLIADYYPVEKRSTAMAIFNLGVPIGSLLGMLVGGWIAELYGWRMAFFAIGLPGLLLAVLLRFTVKEPPRGLADGLATSNTTQDLPDFWSTVQQLWALKSYRYMVAGAALLAMNGYGAATWIPAFLMRYHEMSVAQVGTYLAFVAGICGVLGSLLGGYLGDKLGVRDERWYAWVPAIAVFVSVPFSLGILFLGSTPIVLALILVPTMTAQMHAGPLYATVQNLSTIHTRTLAAGIMLFVINMLGLGLGPLSLGMLSDFLRASYGDDSLRLAMLAGIGIGFVAIAFQCLAAKHLRADLANARTLAAAYKHEMHLV